jgi:membrane protein
MRIIGRIIKSFFDDDCFSLSANIAFCTLLAIVPLTMIMVSIAGYFLGSSGDVFQQIVNGILGVLPVGRQEFIANMKSLMEQRSSLGIVGIIFLVFIATILVGSIERAFDTIFRSVKRRNFFHSRLIGIALIFWITLLFFIPTMIRVLEGLLFRYGFDFPLSEFLTTDVFAFIVAFLSFLTGTVVIPNQKVYVRYAAIGGIVFAAGIGVAKFIFRWYMGIAITRYNLIYGSFTAAILFVVWTYYLAVVLLLAAEVTAQIQAWRRGTANGGTATTVVNE